VANNPYDVLGVKPDATQDQIRAAYRKLAKELHPDLNPGDREAEEKFKTVSVAYDLLGDPEKRARFDRGEIDATGAERPREHYYRNFHGADAQEHPYSSAAGSADFEDILSELFGAQRGARAQPRLRGQDVLYQLPVTFLEAVNGATRRVTLADGSTLDVRIPPGTQDGQVLRLRGKGSAGAGDGPSGDALVAITVEPHPFFTREGDNIEIDLPITLREAVLGTTVSVPTPTGPVRMTVPKNSNTGTRLRLRGKGVARADGPHGDEYVTLKIVLPERPDPELEKFAAGWSADRDWNPRRHLEDAA
jgi:DnaJ-class molecular chaperone